MRVDAFEFQNFSAPVRQTLPLIADMTKTLTKIFLLLIVLTSLTCKKKYPENTLKFNQKPKNYDLMRGVITSYKVNGIDSLDDIGKYLNCYYTNSFRDIDFNTIDTKNRNRVYNSCFGQIAYGWNSDYNFLYVYHQRLS